MKKCSKCGTQYEGNVCPNCGSVGEGRKRCPHCGAIIASASKFCNGCGYSFENKSVPAPTNPAPAKQQSAAAVWAKKHKVAIIISSIVLIVAIVLLSLIPTFIKASVNDTYYAYNALEDKLDTENYITLKTGKWSDSEGLGGTYKVNGKTVTLIVDMFGEKVEFASATVDNGMLSYEIMGEKTVYLSRKHRHSYGNWQNKDELTCTQDETHSRFCGCGKEDIEIITAARGHQGNWTTTKEATCTEYGERETHCTVCDKDIINYIEPIGHSLSADVNTTSHFNYCSRCEQSFDVEEHDNSNGCSICGYPIQYKLETDYNNRQYYSVSGIYPSFEDDELLILSSYKNLPVTQIIGDSFKDCNNLVSLFIPDSITSLSYLPFDDYYNDYRKIPNIIIDEDNVTYKSENNCIFSKDGKTLIIGRKGCIIPNGVSIIGASAFAYCNELTSIVIPDSVKTIDKMAFEECSGLTSITIGNSVTSIGYSAFRNCIGLTSITIPDSVTEIDMNAFAKCSGLTSITIGNSVTNIGQFAFQDCSGLTSITIPDSVTDIDSGAFKGCIGIIQTENSVQYVDTWVIDCDTSTTEVTLRSNTKGIGDSAFSGCSKLTSITIHDSVTSIGGYAFEGCSDLTSITFEGTKEQWNAIKTDSFYPWNKNTSDFKIQCTDGKFDKNGNEIE